MSARLTDLPAITPERVLELKREATALKGAEGLKQSAALARIAEREGFTSWERLVARAGGSEVVREEKRAHPSDAALRRAEKQAERRARYGTSA